MNKELEALNYLIDCLEVDVPPQDLELIMNNQIKTLKRAIKRNEPMATIFTRVTDDLTERFWDEPACPKCKSLVIDEDKFCRECGQKLKWGK